ncbi:MAG: hypothetical protein GX622_00465 [Bacteroidales bacterium]|nr:hypothetical protein [Bacteroidales bacterium]
MRDFLLFFLIAAACLGCDPLAGPVSGRVGFSADTISFDTVFSGMGSATLELRVRNLENDPLLIEHIWLGGGASSPFRLNIDGEAVAEVSDVAIARNDSIIIFIEVTVDPAGGNLPVAVTDSVNFLSGNYSGRVILEAWGQDIRIVDEDILSDANWTEGKPYLINGSLFIDTVATLTLDPGTRVYMHYGSSLIVAGSLRANGSPDKRITFATDRLEEEYLDIPGRWRGIKFLGCSRGNILNHAEIRNAEIAVEIDGMPGYIPDIAMNSAMLMHNSVASLTARNADILAVNSIFAHSGFSTVSLTEGGSYEFVHCTMNNRWEYSHRSEPTLFISPGNGVMPVVSVVNSVISGNLTGELQISASATVAAQWFRADSSLIKVDTMAASWFSSVLFRDVLTTPDPRFIDESAWDFRPDTLSPLLDCAGRSEASLYPYDIRNKPRPSFTGPDMGAYERQAGEKRKEKEE